MIATAPSLTDQGKSLLMRAIGGEQITFTRFKVGRGSLPSGQSADALQDLIAPVLSFPITDMDDTQSGLISLTGEFDNESVTEDFSWRELGIFAHGEDDTEILYAYANDGSDAGIVRQLNTDVLTIQTVTMIIAVGEAQHVTAVYSPHKQYAMADDLKAHMEDGGNPHGVTKDQVGLGNVPNAHPQDTAIDFLENSKMENLNTGEKLRSLMGKLARNIRLFIEHVQSSKNPHSVTLEQVGGAASEHKHDAADVESGVLPMARGGTGVDTLDGLKNLIGTNAQMGIYVGDGTVKRLVPLDFQPSAVILCNSWGMMGDSVKGVCGGVALGAYGLKSPASTLASHATTWNDDYTALLIDDAGFYVNQRDSDVPEEIISTNKSGETYYYIAYR